MGNKENISPDKQAANPYKGLYSYEESDEERFRGREAEKEKLFRLVKYNFLTVIFGKSGIGKTSLLNAGLFPQLRNNRFLPIKISLDYSPQAPGLMEQVRQRIQHELDEKKIRIKEREGTGEVKGIGPDETLWEYFHRVRHVDGNDGKTITPVLVIDQFEEMFTIGKNHQDITGWKDELYYLIEDQFPVSLRERLLKGEEELPYSYSDDTPDIRVVIGLREDYLPHLNSLKSRIPSIDRVMFRVIHLNGIKARQVMDVPGGIQDEKTINDILRLFYPGETEKEGTFPGEELEIEPFILSLLCFQLIEEKDVKIVPGEKPGKILEDFYCSVLKDFPAEVGEFIESKLLTGGGARTPLRLEPHHELRESINKLVSRRILRQFFYNGKEHIEIIHDILAPVIKKSRDNRQEEEKRKKKLEERRKKYSRIIFAIISIAASVLAILTVYAFYQRSIAEQESRNNKAYEVAARSVNMLDKDSIVSFRLAEYAYNKEKTNPGAYNALLKAYYNDKFYSDVLGKKLREFHPKSQTADFFAVFCPDEEKLRFVTASSDQLILWEGNKIEEIKDIKFLRNHLGLRPNAACSPDGKYFAFLTRKDNEIGLWELNGEKIKLVQLEVGVNSVAFSPDSKEILTGNRDNTARLWGLDGTPSKTEFIGHTQEVYSAVFSPNGKYVVTTSWDGTARLWDLDGKQVKELKCQGFGVNSAVFSPDGKSLVTANNDSKARLWGLNGNGEEPLVFDGHQGAVTSAMFSPKSPRGYYIITGSDDNSARLWDLEGNQVFKFEGFNEDIYTASFSPDGKYVLIAPARGPAQLRLIDPEEIIRIVNEKGIRHLTKTEKKEYHLD